MSSITPNLGLIKPTEDEYPDVGTINDNMDVIDSAFLDKIYPVGSIYMSVNAVNPSTFIGGTWERITGSFLLAATDNGSSGAEQAAGNTGGAATVKLTAAQSGLPAHAHGLNSHVHSVGAHSHGLNGHTHSYSAPANHSHGLGAGYALLTTSSAWTEYQYKSNVPNWQSFWHVRPKQWDDAGSSGWFNSGVSLGGTTDSGGASTPATTGGASGSTANSTAFNSGAATGNTANNTAANASSAHENMPPFLSVYMWKRVA